MNYLYCLYFCKKEALRTFIKGTSKFDTYVKPREIETSFDITGIVAVFTPSNGEQKDTLRVWSPMYNNAALSDRKSCEQQQWQFHIIGLN